MIRRSIIAILLAIVSLATVPPTAATPDCRGIEKVFRHLGMDYACSH